MTERDYAIKSFKEITLNAKRHTEQRMDLYYEKIKTLMSDYQDLILENQMVLEELEQECQDKINENMAYALQYMDAYDYRMHIGHLKKEMNNVILIYGLCDMVHRAMTLVKYFTPNFGEEYYDVLYGCYCRSRKAADVDIMIELGMQNILSEVKKGDLERVAFKSGQLRQFFPRDWTVDQMKQEILKILNEHMKQEYKNLEVNGGKDHV